MVKYAANPQGFFDMHGNVREWVMTSNYKVLRYDPEGPAWGSHRVSRGGSWNLDWTHQRSARLPGSSPSYRNDRIGFRVAFQAVQPDTANPELELFGGAAITRGGQIERCTGRKYHRSDRGHGNGGYE